MTKIDVIMGMYNEEKTIERAISSILKQSIEDWRLLICDDGSQDNSFEIAQAYQKKYPNKICVYKNEQNRGLTYTLNKLIGFCNAEYLARMDADDECLPNRFQEQMDFLDNNEHFAFVGSAINKFDEKGIFATVQFPEKPLAKNFLWNNPYVHPTVMIRRKIINQIGGYRDIPATKRCEDYDLWMRLYEKGYKGYNIQTPLLNYYEGRNSYSKRKFEYRVNEAKTRFDGYVRNKLMPIGIIYVIKPFVVGIIPGNILRKLRRKV